MEVNKLTQAFDQSLSQDVVQKPLEQVKRRKPAQHYIQRTVQYLAMVILSVVFLGWSAFRKP